MMQARLGDLWQAFGGSDEATRQVSFTGAGQLPSLYDVTGLAAASAGAAGLALALVIGAAYWLKRSVAGYELEAAGQSPRAAEMAGIPTKRVQVLSMVASGALAGLAGAILVTGTDHRFYASLAGGYGFDSLGVALLSGSSVWAVIPSAFFFALVDASTSRLSFFGVPKGISALLLGLVILVFAAVKFRKEVAK